MIWILLAMTVVSFFVLLYAWTSVVAKIGFDGLGDVLFIVFETILSTMIWPVSLPFAILYLLGVRFNWDASMPRTERFINYVFRKEDDDS